MSWRNLLCGGIFAISLVATVANRVLVFGRYDNELNFSYPMLFWIWFTIIPDLCVLLILYTLLFHIGWKYPRFDVYALALAFAFAVFILLVSSCNIFMLMLTGRHMVWKVVFEVDVVATRSLYTPYRLSFLSLMISYSVLGSILWSTVYRYIQSHKCSQFSHFKILKTLIQGITLMYLTMVLFRQIPQPYLNLSSNMVLRFFPDLMVYCYRKSISTMFDMKESTLHMLTQMMRAPIVNISCPLVMLKKPIKHVFVIILESVRADALPLDKNLAEAVQATFTSDGTAENVTPLLHSLWKNSLHTVASVTSSYTLKSLLSLFCGIYPLNVNFLIEVSPENILYEKCLPELVRETFQTKTNRSSFRSAFFTAARDDFDHQHDLFEKLKFDTVINGFDIYEKRGGLPDLGMFGPADPTILPLMWQWIDSTLAEDKTSQLMMSLLLTGTHDPFPMPEYLPADEYRYYINDGRVNSYLNTIRLSDKLLKKVLNGLKARQLYDDTLFVILGDHGYVFGDHGRISVGLTDTPLESAFSVPLMLYNPYLQAKKLQGQFTNMDVLPTIMDILLSSMPSTQRSLNQLSSVPTHQLQSILSRYEGTSILRKPVKHQPVRYTFHLANPGNSYVAVKQHPRKLTYDITNDEVHLYHLGYDPLELVDLIALADETTASTQPQWLDLDRGENSARIWKGRWASEDTSIMPSNKTDVSTSRWNISNHSKISLKEMLDWADQTFDLARLWPKLVQQRYIYGSKTFDK